MPAGMIINNVEDALVVASKILKTARREVVWLIPPSLVPLLERYGFAERTTPFLMRGGVSRGIVPLSSTNVRAIQTSLSRGENVRHSNDVHELFMFVGDRQYSISSINIGVEEYTLDMPVTAFRSEDPIYAEYLLASFENAWTHAVPAEERLQELAKHGEGHR